MLNRTLKTDLLFLVFAIFWGISFPITQSAISIIDPYLFVFLRFSLASILLLPFVLGKFRNFKLNWLIIGLKLGLLNTAIYLFETLSLKYTTVSRCAFITGSNVILMPFLASIFGMVKITWIEAIIAIIFLIGLYILTGSHFNDINFGDILALLCAISIALSITFVQHISRNKLDESLLTFYQILFTCPIPIILCLTKPITPMVFNLTTTLQIGFCAIFATAIPLLGQIKFQRFTTASQTALIFSLEPVFACLFAYLLNQEIITRTVFLGGSIMLASTFLAIILNSRKERKLAVH